MRAPLLALFLALAARPAGAQTDYLVTSLAGLGNGFVDSVGTNAAFSLVSGAPIMGQLVSNGSVMFVADAGNHAIRLVTAAGAVQRVAGGGPASSGFADGAGASSAKFNSPLGVAVAPGVAGLVYVADTGKKFAPPSALRPFLRNAPLPF